MSQEKVDRYKEQKRNRKAIQAKKKKFLTKLCAGLIAIALVAWLGYSVMYKYDQKQNSGDVTADITALNDYVSGLSTDGDAAE